jgi:hypothetical protein
LLFFNPKKSTLKSPAIVYLFNGAKRRMQKRG